MDECDLNLMPVCLFVCFFQYHYNCNPIVLSSDYGNSEKGSLGIFF